MKVFIFVAMVAAIAMLMPACQKTGPRDTQDHQQTNFPQRPNRVTPNGGGDDDGPIIIHVIKNQSQQAVANASVVMTDDSDSLQLTSNEGGTCTFNLPHNGNWHVRISHDGYQPADTVIYCPDSTKVNTSVLQDQ